MSIDDLVIDLAGNKMADANNKFREIMNQRVNDALDAKKIELAKSLGVPDEEEPEITDVEDEEEIEAADQEDEEYEDNLDDGADEFETEEEAEVEEDEDVQGDENTPQ
jgi:hypothetical protein|tara:strand:+ start:772 stop:1095 length:324 start_codon:yes stop_codon:yes gene_type:complete